MCKCAERHVLCSGLSGMNTLNTVWEPSVALCTPGQGRMNGGTNIALALGSAGQLLRDVSAQGDAARVLVLLTDGRLEYSQRAPPGRMAQAQCTACLRSFGWGRHGCMAQDRFPWPRLACLCCLLARDWWISVRECVSASPAAWHRVRSSSEVPGAHAYPPHVAPLPGVLSACVLAA